MSEETIHPILLSMYNHPETTFIMGDNIRNSGLEDVLYLDLVNKTSKTESLALTFNIMQGLSSKRLLSYEWGTSDIRASIPELEAIALQLKEIYTLGHIPQIFVNGTLYQKNK